MSERYYIDDPYVWDSVDKCQMMTFTPAERSFAERVCELLNEHEDMKNFLCGISKAIMEA